MSNSICTRSSGPAPRVKDVYIAERHENACKRALMASNAIADGDLLEVKDTSADSFDTSDRNEEPSFASVLKEPSFLDLDSGLAPPSSGKSTSVLGEPSSLALDSGSAPPSSDIVKDLVRVTCLAEGMAFFGIGYV